MIKRKKSINLECSDMNALAYECSIGETTLAQHNFARLAVTKNDKDRSRE